MKSIIKCLGSGNAFADGYNYNFNTSFLITIYRDIEFNILLDCGFTILSALKGANKTVKDIDAIYISHVHADHAGGLETLAFSNYFIYNKRRPFLIANYNIINQIKQILSPSLKILKGKNLGDSFLSTYFKVIPLDVFPYGRFIIPKNIPAEKDETDTFCELNSSDVMYISPIPSNHVIETYGTIIATSNKTVYWTSDHDYKTNGGRFISDNSKYTSTQAIDYKTYMNICKKVDIIIHDCESYGDFGSGIHTHWTAIRDLPDSIKKKLYLCHYGNGEKVNHLNNIECLKYGDTIEI